MKSQIKDSKVMTSEQAKAAIERAEKYRASQARAQKKWRDRIHEDEQLARVLLGLPISMPRPAGRRGPKAEQFCVVSHETGKVYEGNSGILISVFSGYRAPVIRQNLRAKQIQYPADPAQWFVDEVNDAGKTLRVTYAENKDNVFSLTETLEPAKL